MILEANADQIKLLDSVQLVQLMRRLLLAEAQTTGIALRAVDVPLQITIADGGEDGRIEWSGGHESTNYLPCRHSVFQAKATNPPPSGWKKEIWTKKSARTPGPKVLSDAARSILDKNGAFIGFCSHPILPQKKDRCIAAIEQGFREAGANPANLADILVYDANKIADWASQHPAVAIWLNELHSGVQFRGFATLERWRERTNLIKIPLAEDTAKRFTVGLAPRRTSKAKQSSRNKNVLDAAGARQRILDFLGEPGRHLRLIGPSGIGKSRFACELLAECDESELTIEKASTVFCDYRDFGSDLAVTLRSLVEARKSGLLVVDECPHDEAVRLQGIVAGDCCGLRLMTIGVEQQLIKDDKSETISITPAGDEMIRQILKSLLNESEPSGLSYIEDLCGGFPRLAVLAAQTYRPDEPVLHSIEDVAERILKGCGIVEPAQMRALECLALFTGLRADDDDAVSFDLVAERLGRLSGDEFYEHLARAEHHQIVDRANGAFSVQPAPLARYLGAKRLDALRTSTILHFIDAGPENVVVAFLDQLGSHDDSSVAKAVATNLLSRNGGLDSFDAINEAFGAACISALAHVHPDGVVYLLDRNLSEAPIETLREFQSGRRKIIDALQRLAFRRRTFDRAARLLLRLAAAETEPENNSVSATAYFKQLFQLVLSGTEATPGERFMIIDEAVEKEDKALLSVCVNALEQTLHRSHFMRAGGAERLGTLPLARDWYPSNWTEVNEFHKSGLQRLLSIRKTFPEFADQCEQAIASNLRSLLTEQLFSDTREAVREIIDTRGVWYEAIERVGDWLYFDRRKGSDKFGDKVRAFYDELLPADEIERAILFTRFWQSDIRDPDAIYDEKDSSSRDIDYSARMAIAAARDIARDSSLTKRAIEIMTPMELNNVFPFARTLGEHVPDSIEAAKTAIESFTTAFQKGEGRQQIGFVCGLLHGIERHSARAGEACLALALEAPALAGYHVNLYASMPMTPARIKEINEKLRAGSLDPRECVIFSYGRTLDGLPEENVADFVDAVLSTDTSRSHWAALEIMSMYFHGKPITQAFAEKVQKIAVAPNLLARSQKAHREAYHLETLIKKLADANMVSDALATGVAEHIIRLCRSDEVENFFNFDSAMRKLIAILGKAAPAPIWAVIARFFETATAWERRKLDELVGAQETSFDNELRNRAGILYRTPPDIFFDWADGDAALRSPFLCVFFPILTDDEKSWHPAFEKAAARFGHLTTFREAIEDRFFPNAWSGSLVPLLTVYLDPLSQWFEHPSEPLAAWARQKHEALLRMIEAERENDE